MSLSYGGDDLARYDEPEDPDDDPGDVCALCGVLLEGGMVLRDDLFPHLCCECGDGVDETDVGCDLCQESGLTRCICGDQVPDEFDDDGEHEFHDVIT